MGWDKYCSYILVTDVDYETQKNRVMQRDNISKDDFDKILENQMDNDVRKNLADIVLNTNKSLNLLKVDLIKITDRLLKC